MKEKIRPLVSVIVPNYNYSRYLAERIQSILNQTFQDFELILLDDASTDNSVDILRQWENHPKVTGLYVNEKNSGSAFAQWDKGVSMAGGKYIWIAEADDLASADFLERMVDALENHPDASVALSMSELIDSDGRPSTHPPYEDFEEDKSVRSFEGKEYLLKSLIFKNTVYNASMVVFRKDCYLRENDGTQLRMRSSGDWYLWARMLRNAKAIEIREKLNYFRLHQASTSKECAKTDLPLYESVIVRIAIARDNKDLRANKTMRRFLYCALRDFRKKTNAQWDALGSIPASGVAAMIAAAGLHNRDYVKLWVQKHLLKRF